MPFIRVAVNLPAISGEYDYHLPEELTGLVGPGHLVTVPFGRQIAQGIALEFVEHPAVAQTRAVIDLLDADPVLTAAQIEFARLLARETLNPLAAIVDMMIPPGLSQHADVVYEIRRKRVENRDERIEKTEDRSDYSLLSTLYSPSPTQKRIIELLSERGPLRGRQIDRHFAKVDWRKSAQALVKQGVLTGKSILPPVSVRPKFIRTAQLAVLPEAAEAAMSTLGKTAATLERRQKALRFFIREPLAANLAWVYAESGCTAADLHELAERELIVLGEAEIFRDPLAKKAGNQESGLRQQGNQGVILTADQEAALAEILPAFALSSPNTQLTNSCSFLLHGVTGSGKTEIYLRATAEALRHGKTVLILVPEIALTPQTVNRFVARFPGQVGLVHSKLSEGERYDTWRRARNGQLSVIIGARSALFAPLKNVGLIVADECHDSSYYQSEPPFYDAIRASQMYARISGAVCILGSATPTVEQKYQAGSDPLNGIKSQVRAVHLPGRLTPLEAGGVLTGASLPPVQVIDMREELKAGRRGIFSRALAEALAETVERGEQAILFLNRRGSATYVFCRDCGYVAKCPNCDTPLTYHVEGFKLKVEGQNLQPSTFNLVCHRCAYSRSMIKKCPQCQGNQIREFGLGSERVEHEVKTLLPAARVLRWDWETTREKDAHELILTHFANHNADILVGTQMLAKGLDLPLVTLVGIVLADVGVNLPDPFAAERAFQVLTQVAGRAGRSERGGRVVMQTFQPDHYAIQTAAGHDYAAFYEREIVHRRGLGYPPFGRLVRLEFRHTDNAEAEKAAKALAVRLSTDLIAESRIGTDLIGPVPCFFAKMNGIYRWQVILRGPDPVSLLRGRLPDGWRVEVDPVSLL